MRDSNNGLSEATPGMLGFLFLAGVVVWLIWGASPFVSMAAVRVSEDYQIFSSFERDYSPNSFEFKDQQAVLYFKSMLKLIVCLIPAMLVLFLTGEKEFLIAGVSILAIYLACRYGFPYVRDGALYGLSIFFESESVGPNWTMELVIKILALVVCGAGFVLIWLQCILFGLVGSFGTEVTVLLAEAVTLIGVPPYVASWIGTLLSPLLLLGTIQR